MHRQLSILRILFFLFLFNVSMGIASTSAAKTNPFTPKASLIRYYNKHISSNLPKPSFLLSKASPMDAIAATFFTNLAAHNSLSSHLASFCSAANLLCSFDSADNHGGKDANFAVYSNRAFVIYGKSRSGGADSFKNYSGEMNAAADSFRRYSSEATGHGETFTNYAENGNVANGSFTNYGSAATGGSGEFRNYDNLVNVPNLRFTTYDSDGNKHKLSFSSYSQDTNSGAEAFIGYSKNGNGVPGEFSSYGGGSNAIESKFSAYGELGNGANDSFKAYGLGANKPNNNFKSYSNGGNAAIDSFSSYRDGSNVGDTSFQSYAKNSNSASTSFVNYGNSFNPGNDSFKEYGKGSKGSTEIEFKTYSADRNFKDYMKNKGVKFSEYRNSKTAISGGISVNKYVEPGKFFRESILKQGNVVRMPDINDKMPARSFLPLSISSKLPFSTSLLEELKEIFHARENSTMERVLVNALAECERAPSRGETKRCVGSGEDMIRFAVSVLGHNVVVRTTRNVNGSKKYVMIGLVKAINGGEVTRSVSCHQSLYPYLLYYCHSVPKVRVYEADILDLESKAKINHGVAICHIDTSAWSPRHGAFVALGSSPGRIEVCHWIFENDMAWTIAD